MSIICPKCDYERQPEDEAPDYECPKCGVIYAKYRKVGRVPEASKPKAAPEPPKEAITPPPAPKNAKLAACRTCGKEVSKTAKTCPHCGEEKPAPASGGSGCALVIIGGVIGLFLLGQCSSPSSTSGGKSASSSSSSEPACTDVVCNSAWDASVRQVERYLKDTLKDPDSYQGIEWSKVSKTGSGFMVRHKYRAKNSFGGYVVDNSVFLLDAQGKVIGALPYTGK